MIYFWYNVRISLDELCLEMEIVKRRTATMRKTPKFLVEYPAKMQAVIGTMNPVHIKETCEASNVKLSHNDWYKLYLASGKFLP